MLEAIGIRQYTSEDTAFLLQAAQESVEHIGPWMNWCTPEFSLSNAEAWVASRLAAFRDGSEFDFVIFSHHGTFLGACALNQIQAQDHRANVGYWVRRSALRCGVASYALRLLADWAFSNTDLFRLEVVIAVENTASQRTALRAGAVYEGTARSRLCLHGIFHDAVIYSILKPEWKRGGI